MIANKPKARSGSMKTRTQNTETPFEKDSKTVHNHIEDILPKLIDEPSSDIPFTRLHPGYLDDYNSTSYLWDQYFCALRFYEAGKIAFLKDHVSLFLKFQNPDNGFVPGTISFTKDRKHCPGNSSRTGATFIAQAALQYIQHSNDIAWAKTIFSKLEKYIESYKIIQPRQLVQMGKFQELPFGLYSNVGGGIDNDPCKFFLESSAKVEGNCYFYLEILSMSKIADMLKQRDKSKKYAAEAESLKNAINKYCWNNEDSIYYNILLEGAPQIKLKCFSGLVPLFAGIADKKQADKIVRNTVMNDEMFLSPFGLRSMSKDCIFYNNALVGNPPPHYHLNCYNASNWQGPVWVLVNFQIVEGLVNYGYCEEAQEITRRMIKTLAADIRKNGVMHENYHAETGQELFCKGFGSWNVLADVMLSRIGKKATVLKAIKSQR